MTKNKKGTRNGRGRSSGRAAWTGSSGSFDAISLGSRLTNVKFVNARAPLPDRYECLMRTISNVTLTPSAGSSDFNAFGLLYKGNVLMSVGSASNSPVGTIGSFSANVPSGAEYLLGSDGTSGAGTGIYQNYVVLGSEVDVLVSRNDSTHQALNLALRPYPVGGRDGGPQYGMSTLTFSEQPYAIRSTVPSQTLAKPVHIRSRVLAKDILGAAPVLALNQAVGQVGSQANDPQVTWYWEVRLNNADLSTSAWTAQVSVQVTHHVIFFNRNGLGSSSPTLLRPPSSASSYSLDTDGEYIRANATLQEDTARERGNVQSAMTSLLPLVTTRAAAATSLGVHALELRLADLEHRLLKLAPAEAAASRAL
jgi:hypothetical protein